MPHPPTQNPCCEQENVLVKFQSGLSYMYFIFDQINDERMSHIYNLTKIDEKGLKRNLY